MTSAIIQLLDLTAILQLGAGVSILFFYQEMLSYVVPHKARAEVITQLSDWKGQIHGDLTDKDINRLNRLIVDKDLSNFKSAITHLGKISFVLLLVLMLIAAHENPGEHYSYDCVLVSSLIFFAYSIITILSIHLKFFSTTATFIIPAGIIAFISTLATINGIVSSESHITFSEYAPYVAISVFCMVIIIAICRFFYDERLAQTLLDDCNELKDMFQKFATWKVTPSEYNFLRIPTQIRRLYPKGRELTPENAQEKFDQFMLEKIQALLTEHPTCKYQIRAYINQHKSLIINTILRFIKLGLMMVVAAYIFICIATFINKQ